MKEEIGFTLKYNDNEYSFILFTQITDVDYVEYFSFDTKKNTYKTKITFNRNGINKNVSIDDPKKIYFNRISDILSNYYILCEVMDDE